MEAITLSRKAVNISKHLRHYILKQCCVALQIVSMQVLFLVMKRCSCCCCGVFILFFCLWEIYKAVPPLSHSFICLNLRILFFCLSLYIPLFCLLLCILLVVFLYVLGFLYAFYHFICLSLGFLSFVFSCILLLVFTYAFLHLTFRPYAFIYLSSLVHSLIVFTHAFLFILSLTNLQSSH